MKRIGVIGEVISYNNHIGIHRRVLYTERNIDMKNLGRVILHYRKQSGYTRVQLAEHICSKDYIYLIEKCKRVPSAEILELICIKLNFDWTEYIPYLNNSDPVASKKLMDSMATLLRKKQYSELGMLIKKFEGHKFAHEYPIQDEILMMKAYSMLNSSGNQCVLLRCIEKIVPIRLTEIDSFSDYDSLTIVQIKALIMYTVILRNLGNIESANNILHNIINAVEDRKVIKGYGGVYVSVILQKAELLIQEKAYNEAFRYALSLYEFQVNSESFEKLGHTLEILADCFKERGEMEESYHYYKFAETVYEMQKMHEKVMKINRKYMDMVGDDEKDNYSG